MSTTHLQEEGREQRAGDPEHLEDSAEDDVDPAQPEDESEGHIRGPPPRAHMIQKLLMEAPALADRARSDKKGGKK